MDDQQADSWYQNVKKHNTNAQGHLPRENAQLEHAEAPYFQLCNISFARICIWWLFDQQRATLINDGKI